MIIAPGFSSNCQEEEALREELTTASSDPCFNDEGELVTELVNG